MHPYFTSLIAEERRAELMREAEHHRLAAAARGDRRTLWSRLVTTVRLPRRVRRRQVRPSAPEIVIDLTNPAAPITEAPIAVGPIAAAPTTAGPIAAAPTAAGPIAAAPTAAGPIAAAPTAAGPIAAAAMGDATGAAAPMGDATGQITPVPARWADAGSSPPAS